MTLWTIAGFDPSSGAGVTADLVVFAAHGFFGCSAITSLTVQSTLGVRASQPVSGALLAATLDCLVDDLPPGGVKIGMLGTAENVAVVADFLERLALVLPVCPIVLDPVLRASSGAELLSPAGIQVMTERLLPQVNWLTPNVDELGVICGREVATAAQVEDAAHELARRRPGLNLVVTGGDRDASDFVRLRDGASFWLHGERIASHATHGTGCAFSSALLCGLVGGSEPRAAVERAKHYVTEAIRRAPPIGHGKGPMHLHWPFDSR